MKGRLAYVIIVLMGLVIAALSWALVYYSRDELGTQTEKRDDRVTSASVAGIESGRAVVHLSAQSQAAGMQGNPQLQELAEAQKEIISATWPRPADACAYSSRAADRSASSEVRI